MKRDLSEIFDQFHCRPPVGLLMVLENYILRRIVVALKNENALNDIGIEVVEPPIAAGNLSKSSPVLSSSKSYIFTSADEENEVTEGEAQEELKRKWKGCDISADYCKISADRIENVKEWSIDRWLKFDQENTDRRKSIR